MPMNRPTRCSAASSIRRSEAAEQYDQPVLVRLGTKDEDELRGGFPKTAEELYKYDAVILDDVEAAFFTQDQQSLVKNFVSRRGGGLLMLGGPDSLDSGKIRPHADRRRAACVCRREICNRVACRTQVSPVAHARRLAAAVGSYAED